MTTLFRSKLSISKLPYKRSSQRLRCDNLILFAPTSDLFVKLFSTIALNASFEAHRCQRPRKRSACSDLKRSRAWLAATVLLLFHSTFIHSASTPLLWETKSTFRLTLIKAFAYFTYACRSKSSRACTQKLLIDSCSRSFAFEHPVRMPNPTTSVLLSQIEKLTESSIAALFRALSVFSLLLLCSSLEPNFP